PLDGPGGRIPAEAAGVAHALGLGEEVLAAPQSVLGPLQVVDVGAGAVPADDAPGLVAPRAGAEQEPAIGAVVAARRSLDLAGIPRCNDGGPALGDALGVVGVQRGSPAPVAGLLHRHPSVLEPRPVQKFHRAIWVCTPRK